MHSKLNAKSLLKKGVPYILIPGILLADALGWKNNKFEKISREGKMKVSPHRLWLKEPTLSVPALKCTA